MLYDDPRNSPKATFTQVSNRNFIKPVWFLKRKFACVHRGQSVFVPVLVLFTRVHSHIGRKTFPTKTNKRNLIYLQNSSNTAKREVNLYC